MRSQWQDPGYGGGGMQFAMPRATPVVKLLLIANIAIFVLSTIIDPGGGAFDTFVKRAFALHPGVWREWFPFLPVWQLWTYGFLHAGVGHILGNMLFLFFLGSMLEEAVGSRRFTVFYLAVVPIAGLAQLSLGLAMGQLLPIVGASGGVLGIVCAMATLRPDARIIFIILPITLKTLAIFYVSLDLFYQILELRGQGSGTASLAHLTGALLGFLAVRRGWIWKDPLETLERARRQREDQRTADDQARLDELLAKINRDGIQSLSGRERAFLKRVSKRP